MVLRLGEVTGHGVQYRVANMRDDYRRIVADVKAYGELVAPRDEATRELTGVTVILSNPADALPVGVGRGINPAIAAAEAAQLIAGEEWPGLLTSISGNFERFKDGEVFHGGYPHRSSHQYWPVINRLHADRYTRRAVMTFWDPARDNEDGKQNYPCTTSIQFLVRGGRLDAHVYMRANDVWHGFAYDVFTFTQLQHSVAHAVGVPAGRYYHYASSLHLYERDIDAATRMLNTGFDAYAEPDTRARGLTRAQAKALLRGTVPDIANGKLLSSFEWYREKLARVLPS